MRLAYLFVLLACQQVLAQPVLQRLSSPSGKAGSPVELIGSGFGTAPNSLKVFFDQVPAEIRQCEPGKVAVKVPDSAPKNSQIRVELDGLSSSPLPFLCLPSIRLTVDKNPIDQGEKTIGHFRVLHEDKAIDLHFKNASPDVVKFSGGNEQTVKTSGGSDNHFDFDIEGLQGNRLYTVDYQWGAQAVQIIEWQLGWNQIDWLEKGAIVDGPIEIGNPVPVGNPDPTPTVPSDDRKTPRILDIHPLQVVQSPAYEAENEDLDLVRQKPTMVKVFVELPREINYLPKATLKLSWIEEGKELNDEVTADLIRVGTRTWVVPAEVAPQANDSPSERVRKYLEESAQSSLDKMGDEYFSYNFRFGNGRECPAHGELKLVSSLRMAGKEVDRKIEASGSQFHVAHFKWEPHSRFTIQVCYVETTSGAEKVSPVVPSTMDEDELSKFIEERAAYIRNTVLAVFPIPPSRLDVAVEKSQYWKISRIPWFSAPGLGEDLNLKLEGIYPNCDAIVVVTNTKNVTGLWRGDRDGHTPAGIDRTHYIVPDLKAASLLPAHEIGHDSKFFGAPHIERPVVVDAWDAGGHVGMSRSKTGLACLMQTHDPARDWTERNWIDAQEYRLLLNKMTVRDE